MLLQEFGHVLGAGVLQIGAADQLGRNRTFGKLALGARSSDHDIVHVGSRVAFGKRGSFGTGVSRVGRHDEGEYEEQTHFLFLRAVGRG